MEAKPQYITKTIGIDSAHRVMNEAMKCFNVHGHRYEVELTFAFFSMEEIGYAIDFKEIKRVGCQWIDDMLDHGIILNPHDKELLEVSEKLGSKIWLMSLNGSGEYCNPTVENIAKEIFLAMKILFLNRPGLEVYNVRVKETPSCWTDCNFVDEKEIRNFEETKGLSILNYSKDKGVVEYDNRKN